MTSGSGTSLEYLTHDAEASLNAPAGRERIPSIEPSQDSTSKAQTAKSEPLIAIERPGDDLPW